MNKKEVMEIRRQFTPANCAIDRICGCYVDHEKKKKMEAKDAFLTLPEEETFKYFDIFKKTLSGSLGKNLLNLEFPLEQELPDGTQAFLLKLRDSGLDDGDLVEEFYDKIIEEYVCPENYYIILIHAMYDIPGRGSDNLALDDASEHVYEFVLCSICPVALSKAGLCYHAEDNRMAERVRDWIVGMPDCGFLFPAFCDREPDIHAALYYTKKSSELQTGLLDRVLGAKETLSAADQKLVFQAVVEDTLGADADYETVRDIHGAIGELIEEHADDGEPLCLDGAQMKQVFGESGVPEEKLENFEKIYEETAGEKTSLLAQNITETRKFVIETPDVVIRVRPECTDLIETRVIDGRQCLVIAVDDHIEVNGMRVRTMRRGDVREAVDGAAEEPRQGD